MTTGLDRKLIERKDYLFQTRTLITSSQNEYEFGKYEKWITPGKKLGISTFSKTSTLTKTRSRSVKTKTIFACGCECSITTQTDLKWPLTPIDKTLDTNKR